MAIIDISITESPAPIENVVNIPCRYDETYTLVKIHRFMGMPRFQCPGCRNAYLRNAHDDYFRCRPLEELALGRTRYCKTALARNEGTACPIGLRNPE